MPAEHGSGNEYTVQADTLEPFGYRRFESAQDFPDPPPLTTAQGLSLYENYESTHNDNWIDGFLHRSADPDEFGTELTGELPETFVGMSTTLGPQNQSDAMENPSPYTNDVHNPFQVAAEESLSQEPGQPQYDALGGQLYPSKQRQSNNGLFNTFENYDSFPGYSTSPYEPSYQATHNSNNFFPTPPLSNNMPNFFDNASYIPNQRSVQTPRRLQFGSDARFVGHNFVAPPEQETEETLVKRKMKDLECLKPEESPASTHPSSPVLQKKARHSGPFTINTQSSSLPTSRSKPHFYTSTPENSERKPRKRRKTGPDSDPDFEETHKPTRKASQRSKATGSKAPAPSREASASKSRPSSAKPNRQHLTDEQKKTNHIISEQKRRDLIAQGYEGIRQLVPALRDVKHSKGAMLESAADWLQDIVQTNEFLRAHLAALKRR